MPRRTASMPAVHHRGQAADGGSCQLRGITGSSALKGHIAVDPDSEIITATAVTPGNSRDAEAAAGLLDDLLCAGQDGDGSASEAQAAVYGDAAYGSGELLETVEQAGLRAGIKVQPPPAPKGHFPKDRFGIDLQTGTVTCPAGITTAIRARGGRHVGRPASARPVAPARSQRSAPPHPTAARSPSARTRHGWPPPGSARQTRPGKPTTRQPGPRSSARSAISCAGATAGDVPGSAARPGSPLTSPCSPRRSTSPGSACSAWHGIAEPGW